MKSTTVHDATGSDSELFRLWTQQEDKWAHKSIYVRYISNVKVDP